MYSKPGEEQETKKYLDCTGITVASLPVLYNGGWMPRMRAARSWLSIVSCSGDVLLLVDDVEQAGDALSPHVVLPPAAALELYHALLRRPQPEVAALLAALQ